MNLFSTSETGIEDAVQSAVAEVSKTVFKATDQSINQSINTIIGNGKRFMAYEIIKRLPAKKENDLLLTLQNNVEKGKPIINFMRYGNYHSIGSIVKVRHL